MSRKISLVLGSGGARGITHIGVVKLLQERGYVIDEIVGCSIGALVGAAFAEGKISELGKWMSKLTKRSVFGLMDFSDPRFGFLKGDRVFQTLESVFEDCNIEDLDIKFTAVATDIINEREMIFRSGSLYKSIRASIAIPAVFKGVNVDNSFLVDGGVLNPLPINYVQNKANIIVAVNLDGYPEVRVLKEINKMNSLDVLQESYLIMRRRLASMIIDRYTPDYLINIPHNISGIWDFDKSVDLIQRGYEIAAAVIPDEIK